eukprot:TRINITY_DN3961_c0_g1_i1.p1 TRINITY_DN3961_c0_g1~~TRINITY_DN3961_c0_g1_i1.p1  ORF type:complete len:171 (-),score=36.71 TRINITY_DN3961_c0_g1_i1:152-664(-)
MFIFFILVQCLALRTFCQDSEIKTDNVPETKEITAVLKNPNKSLEKTTRVLRGPVDHTVELVIHESCREWQDGTKCTKRCLDLSCDPVQARCWQGHCKRAGHHPCDMTDTHQCCCGDCSKATTDPVNAACFQNFLNQKKKIKKKTKKNKNKKESLKVQKEKNKFRSIVKV